MSARHELCVALRMNGVNDAEAEAIADGILAQRDRELAEKIRKRADLHNVGLDEGGGWHEGMRDASILITPKG